MKLFLFPENYQFMTYPALHELRPMMLSFEHFYVHNSLSFVNASDYDNSLVNQDLKKKNNIPFLKVNYHEIFIRSFDKLFF